MLGDLLQKSIPSIALSAGVTVCPLQLQWDIFHTQPSLLNSMLQTSKWALVHENIMKITFDMHFKNTSCFSSFHSCWNFCPVVLLTMPGSTSVFSWVLVCLEGFLWCVGLLVFCFVYFSLYGFLRDFYFTFLTHCLFSPKHCSATSQMPFPLYGYGKIWRLSCFSDAASRNFSCSIFSPLNLAGHLRTNISRAGFFQRFLGTQED